MRFKLISCEVFHREIQAVVERSPNEVDVEFLSKGLHELGCWRMRQRLQNALAQVEQSRYDAILLGYGLCNNGLAGLEAKSIPLVAPRAHDCITLLLGSKERYLDYFLNHPGAYFKSSGWIERSKNPEELNQLSITQRLGMNLSYEDLVAKYGQDNADFLHAEFCDQTKNYSQFTFIEMGVEPDDRFERQTREEAARQGWKFEKVAGDLSLLQRMIDGPWDDREFLVVPPGWRLVANYDEGIISAEKVEPETKADRPDSIGIPGEQPACAGHCAR